MGLIRPWGEATVKISLELGQDSASNYPIDDRVMVRSFREGAHRTFALRCIFPSRRDPTQQDGVMQAVRQFRAPSQAQGEKNIGAQEVQSPDHRGILAESVSRGGYANFCHDRVTVNARAPSAHPPDFDGAT